MLEQTFKRPAVKTETAAGQGYVQYQTMLARAGSISSDSINLGKILKPSRQTVQSILDGQ